MFGRLGWASRGVDKNRNNFWQEADGATIRVPVDWIFLALSNGLFAVSLRPEIRKLKNHPASRTSQPTINKYISARVAQKIKSNCGLARWEEALVWSLDRLIGTFWFCCNSGRVWARVEIFGPVDSKNKKAPPGHGRWSLAESGEVLNLGTGDRAVREVPVDSKFWALSTGISISDLPSSSETQEQKWNITGPAKARLHLHDSRRENNFMYSLGMSVGRETG